MRKELDDVLGPIDYIASRRTRQLIISVPIGQNLVLASASPTQMIKKLLKKLKNYLTI